MRKILKCCARKSYQSSSGKTEDQISYSIQEIRAISRTNKTTSTLFRYQKAVPVGMCHDVCGLCYHNHLYNRISQNQSIESLNCLRIERRPRALVSFTKNSAKVSSSAKKIFKSFICSQYSFVSTQCKNISGIE